MGDTVYLPTPAKEVLHLPIEVFHIE